VAIGVAGLSQVAVGLLLWLVLRGKARQAASVTA
jgi:hypothetical protein